ncbi:unnamed protein product [Adineta ricciae]|uniref:G-protein coupled receptors family 1 profile domain-containing protein n=1 Tax=Adineta ricciae TaxID=249248 RepID=A0A814CTS4_ADIRI|nr:unnamed protein product [Adineta ricciae]CAF0944876.1 unnamed protein product [Adineta ricciae]
MSTLTLVARNLLVYGGSFVFVLGVVGNVLNIILFLSLKTFRETSAVMYLLLTSFAHIGLLLAGLITRIAYNIFAVDWTTLSVVYCKFRIYFFHFCGLCALAGISLAIIDQFLATSTRPQWRQCSNSKNARYLSILTLIFWLAYLCPHLVNFDIVVDDRPSCAITNSVYAKYYNDIFIPVIWFILPYSIIILFGLLTYRNIRNISYRTVPLLRRRIDEQLTMMIYIQATFSVMITIPYMIYLTVLSHVSFSADQFTMDRLLLVQNSVILLYYTCSASPFYIYVCASERFRRQLHHVFTGYFRNRWQKRRVHVIDIF